MVSNSFDIIAEKVKIVFKNSVLDRLGLFGSLDLHWDISIGFHLFKTNIPW